MSFIMSLNALIKAFITDNDIVQRMHVCICVYMQI